jgi:hypothetical protein
MDNYQEIINKIEEVWDILDLLDINHDIIEGKTLINKRITTPKYIYNQYGYIENNSDYIQNENDIVNYINKIIQKYNDFIKLYNYGVKLRQQAFQNNGNDMTNNFTMNNIEAYVSLLITIQNAKILGKATEEIFK